MRFCFVGYYRCIDSPDLEMTTLEKCVPGTETLLKAWGNLCGTVETGLPGTNYFFSGVAVSKKQPGFSTNTQPRGTTTQKWYSTSSDTKCLKYVILNLIKWTACDGTNKDIKFCLTVKWTCLNLLSLQCVCVCGGDPKHIKIIPEKHQYIV